MNLDQIKQTLEATFSKPCEDGYARHIVFWYDENAEFIDDIDELGIENAKLWKLEDNNNFLTKYTMEVLDPKSNYLIYSNKAKPEDRNNWLLDMVLYSYEFTADKVTLIMNGLGIQDPTLRPLFQKYTDFFNSKQRFAQFVSYNIDQYTEDTLDLAVLSALTKQPSLNSEGMLRSVLMASLDEKNNKLWNNILKFGDEDAFWRLMEQTYRYVREERSLRHLLLFLMITALDRQLQVELPDSWKRYVSAQWTDCVVFLDHFMNHRVDAQVYDQLADAMQQELHLEQHLQHWDVRDYEDADLFRIFDQAIIEYLVQVLLLGSEEFDLYQEIIRKRQTKHFYPEFQHTYEALRWAIDVYRFRKDYHAGLPDMEANRFFETYTEEYYQVDYAYRKFCRALEASQQREVLDPIGDEVERIYSNWYLEELSHKWSRCVEEELADQWSLTGITSQTQLPRSMLDWNKEERTFVIISDALRYEAAHELMDTLNAKVEGITEIQPMLGVVPSYTQLGMAALLAKERGSIDMIGSDVVIEGIPVTSTANREMILKKQRKESLVLKLNDLMQMNRQQMRDTLRGQKMVYVYHNVIDAIGDKQATEAKTFRAVADAIDEITSAISHLNKHISSANVYITSDHGFLYQRKPLEESDKIETGSAKALLSGKRWMVFDQEVDQPGTLCIRLQYIFGNKRDLVVLTPKGNNRFRRSGGGSNFVHGGASLQEIVIPLVHYQNSSSKDPQKQVSKVEVRLTSTTRRITNTIFTLDFFQTRSVEDKRIPRTVKLYFVDADGNKISNEGLILANKTSNTPGERTFRISFTLESRSYSRNEEYRLIMEDTEETVEGIYDEIPFEIDVGIMDDFGFDV